MKCCSGVSIIVRDGSPDSENPRALEASGRKPEREPEVVVVENNIEPCAG